MLARIFGIGLISGGLLTGISTLTDASRDNMLFTAGFLLSLGLTFCLSGEKLDASMLRRVRRK
jgi:hypothetical protein